MSLGDWQRAEEIEWEGYYRVVEGRALREVFVEALPFLPKASPGERPPVAVDLGCGDGKESLELLALGWTVLATDRAPEGIERLLESAPPEASERLTTAVAAFAEVDFPHADLVYAGFSLPFCPPAEFEHVWRDLVAALRPGGFFVGHLFGPHDTWAGTPDMTFHSRAEVEQLVTGFEIISLREQDEDGAAVGGPKHWHLFHVICRKLGESAAEADRDQFVTAARVDRQAAESRIEKPRYRGFSLVGGAGLEPAATCV